MGMQHQPPSPGPVVAHEELRQLPEQQRPWSGGPMHAEPAGRQANPEPGQQAGPADPGARVRPVHEGGRAQSPSIPPASGTPASTSQ
jgi:hypothetical protein